MQHDFELAKQVRQIATPDRKMMEFELDFLPFDYLATNRGGSAEAATIVSRP